MNAPEMAQALKQKFGDAVLEVKEFRGEQTLVVKLASAKPMLKYCRDELNFDYLVDVSSLDYMGREPRFEMVYELYGYGHLQHLRKTPLGQPTAARPQSLAHRHQPPRHLLPAPPQI